MQDYDEVIVDWLENAEGMKLEGRHDEAIRLLEQVIISDMNCIEAYEELGDNYISLKKPLKARRALEQALRIDPTSPNAHYLLGFMFSIQEDWSNSVNELEKADAQAPNHPEILRCLGWSTYNSNRKNQGISILERAHHLNPFDANILCDLGVCYMNSFQYPRAEETFKLALKVDPNSTQAMECMRVLNSMKSSKSLRPGASSQVRRSSTDNTTGDAEVASE